MNIPDNLLYTKEHEWIKIEDNMAVIGITDYAQGQLGDVVFVELPEVGSVVSAHDPLGVIESVKTVSDIYAPLSGEVKEINADLESESALINSEPYNNGWIVKIHMKEREELKTLLSHEQYAAYVAEEQQV